MITKEPLDQIITKERLDRVSDLYDKALKKHLRLAMMKQAVETADRAVSKDAERSPKCAQRKSR